MPATTPAAGHGVDVVRRRGRTCRTPPAAPARGTGCPGRAAGRRGRAPAACRGRCAWRARSPSRPGAPGPAARAGRRRGRAWSGGRSIGVVVTPRRLAIVNLGAIASGAERPRAGVVPRPGAVSRASVPPAAATRASMPSSPPGRHRARGRNRGRCRSRVKVRCGQPAHGDAAPRWRRSAWPRWSAPPGCRSRPPTSTCCGSVARTSATSRVTGTTERRAVDWRAATRPRSVRSGG